MFPPFFRVVLHTLFVFTAALPIWAQHCMNDGSGQFTNSTGAILRLRAAAGEVRNSNATLALVRNFGTIELQGASNRFTGAVPLGAQAASRIGGLVRYTTANFSTLQQTLHARFYSNLDLDGFATKRIPDGVFVGGDDDSTGRFTVRGGARVYEGTFFYDNSRAQRIVGGETYQNIEIQRGLQPKRIALNDNVSTLGSFRQNPSNEAGLQILGALNIGTNAEFPATPMQRGTIEVGTSANFRISAALNVGRGRTVIGVREVRIVSGILATRFNTAEILVQTGATLRLADVSVLQANTFGRLALTSATQSLTVSGLLKNERLECDNVQFHPQSLVLYNASNDASSRQLQTFPQEIMRTLPNAPYGNLQCSASDKILAPLPLGSAPNLSTAMVSLAGDLRVNDAVLDVSVGSTNPDSTGLVFILNPDARVEYSALAEVRGAVRRIFTRLPSASSSFSSSNFVFNNATTRFLATTRTVPDTMTIAILQGASPRVYEAVTDVRRRILCTYSEHSDRTWEGNVQIGYRQSEILPPFQATNEQHLSLWAISQPQNASQNTSQDSIRRIATTQLFRASASRLGFGIVEQFALTNAPTSLFRLRSGEEILLRGKQETVRSVQHGRWSNPLTWNVLRQPTANDSVEVNHAVHLGFRRFAVDGNTPLGQIREQATSNATPIAAGVRVNSSPNAALLLGSLSKIRANTPATFDDEMPPEGRAWQAGALETRPAAPLRNDTTITQATSVQATFEELLGIRTASLSEQPPYQGIVLFTPREGRDSAIMRVQSIANAGRIVNGIVLETAQTLESTGEITNAGTLSQRGAETRIRQAEIGGWVRFTGDSVMLNSPPNTAPLLVLPQRVPSLTYSRLSLEGRRPKQNTDTAPILVRDSLHIEARANITLPQNGEMNLFGGMLLNGSIDAPLQSSVLRLNGMTRQAIQGFGTMDACAIQNPRGVQVLRSEEVGRGLVIRSRLDLTLGAMQIQDRANLLLEDNVLISRRAESSLSSEPLRVARVRLRTLGNRAMTATGELPTDSLALRSMEILNVGGYTLTKTAYILDSLTVASKLIAEISPDNAHSVVLRSPNTLTNPRFLTDSAEIIGAVRRTIPRDTVTRLFNNRYAFVKLINADVLVDNGNNIMATMRIIPSVQPEPNADSTKVRRAITLDLAQSDNAPIPSSLLARVGYAWNASDGRNESNNLDISRIALQNWLPIKSPVPNAAGAWQTLGVPFRPSIRSAWNRASESGAWQVGAMDSVRIGLTTSRYLALGIDSMLSVLPSAFVQARVLLEGAYQPAYLLGSLLSEGRMRTLLAREQLLPERFDSTKTTHNGNLERLTNTRVQVFPASIVDWLLLEFRPVRFQDSTLWVPALLRQDGAVLGTDTRTPLRVELPTDNEEFQVFVHHRNHTSLAFAETVKLLPSGSLSLDFTQENSLANREKSARTVDVRADGTRVFSMRSGDAFGNDGAINRFDYDAALEAAWNRLFEQGYLRGDADLNGIITTKDLNRIWNNRNSNGAVRKP